MIVRDVAQPGSAHVWGAWGRKFKSCRPDFMAANAHNSPKTEMFSGFFMVFYINLSH
jgi:hypothetical protein